MEKHRLILLITILIVVLIIIEIVAFYMLRNRKNDITPDGPSINRIKTIQQVLRSYFGDNYVISISIILISILTILFMLYFLIKKIDKVEINLNPVNEKILVTIFSTGYLIYVGFSIYLFMRMNKENSDDKNNENSDVDLARKRFLKMSMYILSIIIMGFILIGLILYLFSKFRG